MRRSLKVRLALAAMTVGAVAVAALPASASTGTFVFTGAGTISPGLTQAGGTSQTFVFDTILDVSVSIGPGIVSLPCQVTGNDSIGSWSQGAGGFSGSCPGSGSSVESLAGTYVRTGDAVTLTGIAAGLFGGSLNGGCAWVPINIDTLTQKITEFSISCPLTLT